MAMVRQNLTMEEPVRTTTKILNLYNKSADPSNKTGSLVLTTTIPNGVAGSEGDAADFDASEITVIFEDEIETLYVGPVEISEEEQAKKKRLEEAAATAREEEIARGVQRGAGGARKAATILNAGASSPATATTNTSPGGGKGARMTNGSALLSSGPVATAKAELASHLNGESDSSGIDNGMTRDDNNKKKNTVKSSSSRLSKELSKEPQKQTKTPDKPTEMVIKKRGRPPGVKTPGQPVAKVQKSEVEQPVKVAATTTTKAAKTEVAVNVVTSPAAMTPIRSEQPAAIKQKASISPRAQYECELCEEIFSREDTIVDHYQSYHRVDPKKRTIKPRVNIPKEDDNEEEQEVLIQVAAASSSSAVAAVSKQHKAAVETHSTKPKEKKLPSGMICGKCNLTFRTMLLLSRHVKEMHDSKPAPEEDDEDDEDDDEEEEAEEEEEEEELVIQPKKARGKENHRDSLAGSSSISVVEVKKARGRPKKTDASPRILNADKGLVRVRMPKMEAGENDTSLEEDVKQSVATAARRNRKRKMSSFAEDDRENAVVPKVVPHKQPRANARQSTTIKVNEADLTDDQGNVIYVEVLNNKVEEDDYLDEDGEDGANTSGTLNGSDTMVYKIKDATAVEKDGHRKFPCPLCDLTFTRRYSLEPHIQRVHQKLRTKECPYCDRKFQATGDLTRHITIHTKNKPYECTVEGCAFRFVSRSDQIKHELRHTEGVPKTYVCGACDKSFERPYDLRRHQTTHKDMQVEFRSYNCEQCDRGFTRRDEYRAHMYRHLGVKPLKCHLCGKPFTDNSNLSKHCKAHGPLTHDGPEDPMECGDCGEKFTNVSALSRHQVRCLHERSDMPVHSVPQWDYFEDDSK